MVPWQALQRLAIDLTEGLRAADRYERLLAVVRSAIRCDATALLALHDGDLVPLAVHGLSPQVLGMRFSPARHPRLDAILRADAPTRFPAASDLPDPFDGLVGGLPEGALAVVHDCLGCPLVAGGRVVGVLTADAIAAGAFDALDRDFLIALGALAGAALHTARLIETVERLAEQRGRVVEALTRGGGAHGTAQMLGTSPAIERVRREIDAVAGTDFPVLVLGETGVGKDLAARAIHAGSARREAPFIQVNCAALPEGVIESELFGHVRGAFTGATANRPGKFEIADGGTLFLDEIGELSPLVQAKLLRVLQDGEVQRVGADRPARVSVRIVAATNRDLADEIARGRFRADLYHRLDVFPLRVPPLRERRADIAILAGYFLDRHRVQLGIGRVALTPAALAALDAAAWPGNVRELDHVLARAALRAKLRARGAAAVLVEAADLGLGAAPANPLHAPAPEGDARAATAAGPALATVTAARAALARQIARGDVTLRDAVEALKRDAVAATLDETARNWAEAARRLGMNRGNLHHMAQRLGVRRS